MTSKGTKKAFLRVPAHIGEKARLQAERAFVHDQTPQADAAGGDKEKNRPELNGVLSERQEEHEEQRGSTSLASIEEGLASAQAFTGATSTGVAFDDADQRTPGAELSVQESVFTEPRQAPTSKEEASLTLTVGRGGGSAFSHAEGAKHASKLPYAHRRVWADSVLRIEQAFYELAANQSTNGSGGPCRWRRNQLARAAGLRSAQTVDEAVRVLIGLGLVRRRSLRGPQGAEFELQQGSVEPEALAQRMAEGLRLLAARIERLEPEAWRERAVVQVIERVASALAVFEETPQLLE